MSYQNKQIAEVAALLKERLGQDASLNPSKAIELKALFEQLKTMPKEERGLFGKELNLLKSELEALTGAGASNMSKKPIDVTAPMDINSPKPSVLPARLGSRHPLMTELDTVIEIFAKMGFVHLDSRQLDDEYHMFSALNFPEGHPARDDYDTFMTEEKDENGHPFIAPAHVSTMQNRLQKMYRSNLERDEPIAVVYTGRTFRNEDVDARHEHTFYQVEISYIGKNIHAGNLIATFKTFLETYYEQDIEVRMQPFYFPFTEPSFEMALSCPFCQKKGCSVCSYDGWIELLGCGMINPNVLQQGGIDPSVYTGFAGGLGLDRLVMMKHGIEDVRHFHSGKLDFLRQFA